MFSFKTKGQSIFTAAINRSLPQTVDAATVQDRSYTNMYIMATVTSILFGEMSETIPSMIPLERAKKAKLVGYTMWDEFYTYTSSAGVHEFVSPTYANVQLGPCTWVTCIVKTLLSKPKLSMS